MQVNENKNGDVVVLSVTGRLDSNTSPDFEERLLGRIRDGERKLVLDFGELEYISSAGLRVLLKATREVKAQNGKLVICGARDYIQEVFDLSGFTTVFALAPDLGGAVGQF
ncbi:anti-anti-sigma regulatory factor, SpoIIAA [Desulfovibrio sp. X2]|uniref:STAS domain-containing protein n=1 Tax=Desulfovibrio sp. X2 TaxID=941449 RepID=UPI000358CA99|nr:STAS domain-containing protein [Desulfovibrio sp. X2]EPR41740.1 anti-anti-sigma regulatory factor, SpoIIAA [Desulfovibrio sp. X2]